MSRVICGCSSEFSADTTARRTVAFSSPIRSSNDGYAARSPIIARAPAAATVDSGSSANALPQSRDCLRIADPTERHNGRLANLDLVGIRPLDHAAGTTRPRPVAPGLPPPPDDSQAATATA